MTFRIFVYIFVTKKTVFHFFTEDGVSLNAYKFILCLYILNNSRTFDEIFFKFQTKTSQKHWKTFN